MGSDSAHEIKQFLQRIHGNYEGIAFTTQREERNPAHNVLPKPFLSPKNREQFSQALSAASRVDTVYFSPALFKNRQNHNQRDNFKHSKWLWVDIDEGQGPQAIANLNGLPLPSIIVESSPDNYHLYWELDQPCDDVEILERANKGIIKALRVGDPSSWDAGQLLRIPGTYNHKSEEPFRVSILEDNRNRSYSLAAFPIEDEYIDPNITIELNIDWNSLPDVDVVLKSYNVPKATLAVIQEATPHDRSGALHRIGLDLIEYVAGIRDDEIYVVLESCDNRWGKYTDDDSSIRQRKELCRIIQKGRHKQTLVFQREAGGLRFTTVRELQFLSRTKPTFIFGDFIPYRSLVTMVGPPGLGKTYFAMNLLAYAVARTDFLLFPFNQHLEIRPAYVTMEMSQDYVGLYSNRVASLFKDDTKRNILDTWGCHAFPSASNLWDSQIQEDLVHAIDQHKTNFLVVDSTTTAGGDGDHTADFYDFISDTLIKDLKCTVMLLTHDRKPSQDAPRKEIGLNDILNSRMHGLRPDVVVAVEGIKNTTNYKLRSLKTRAGQDFDEVTYIRANYGFKLLEKKEVKDDSDPSTKFGT